MLDNQYPYLPPILMIK